MIAAVSKITETETPVGTDLLFDDEIPGTDGWQIVTSGKGPADPDRKCESRIGARHALAAECGGEWIGHTKRAVRVSKARINQTEDRSERSNAAEAVDLVGIRQRVVESGAAADYGCRVDAI